MLDQKKSDQLNNIRDELLKFKSTKRMFFCLFYQNFLFFVNYFKASIVLFYIL